MNDTIATTTLDTATFIRMNGGVLLRCEAITERSTRWVFRRDAASERAYEQFESATGSAAGIVNFLETRRNMIAESRRAAMAFYTNGGNSNHDSHAFQRAKGPRL